MMVSGLLLFACALLAFALSSICGGGAGLLLIPILGSLLPAAQIPVALSLGTFTSSASRIAVFRAQIRWDVVRWFVPPALPAVWLGVWLLKYINPLYLELLMGLFLVANLPLIFRPASQAQSTRPKATGYLSLIGFAAGFVSGLTGAVGLLFNRFYLRYGLSKEQIMATRAANELLLHLVKLSLYASFGLLSGKAITLGALVATAAIVAAWLMKRLLPYLSEGLFRRIGYGAMVVSGLSLFMEAGSSLVRTNGVQLSYVPISGGLETNLQWRHRLFTLEFEYDEGFEYERRIELADLPAKQQARVRFFSQGADNIVLEEVFGLHKHDYEAYLYRHGRVEKLDL